MRTRLVLPAPFGPISQLIGAEIDRDDTRRLGARGNGQPSRERHPDDGGASTKAAYPRAAAATTRHRRPPSALPLRGGAGADGLRDSGVGRRKYTSDHRGHPARGRSTRSRQVSWLAGRRFHLAFPMRSASVTRAMETRRLQLRGQPRNSRARGAPGSLFAPDMVNPENRERQTLCLMWPSVKGERNRAVKHRWLVGIRRLRASVVSSLTEAKRKFEKQQSRNRAARMRRQDASRYVPHLGHTREPIPLMLNRCR
jgi:hypothetical protein